MRSTNPNENHGDLAYRRSILLFFRDFEKDSFIRGDRRVKRLLRPLYAHLLPKHSTSGFRVWHENLTRSLRSQGYKVYINRYDLAQKNPYYPVGVMGYPTVLNGFSFNNPAILGPGLYDHPRQAPGLMDDDRFRFYITTCEWNFRLFHQVYGDKCIIWHGAIDTNYWCDTQYHNKPFDVLIYDKIRWNREVLVPKLLLRSIQMLNELGLTYRIIRYGRHNQRQYKRLLSRSRAMIFLCEHETQGMAYQEALSCNVPVLAWDNGYWLDPQRFVYGETCVPASSVPYFSADCGTTFKDYRDIEPAFSRFWNNLSRFRPRDYVKQKLSASSSANIYTEYYFSLF